MQISLPARPIVYLTAIEDVAQSPLIRGQVIALLKTMADRNVPRPLALVALYPLINWGRQRERLAGLRSELADHNIGLHVWPILFLTRHFYMSRSWLTLFRIQARLAAQVIARRLQPALVHCRSYPAALVGAEVKRMTGSRFIFDTRALYPEEGATLARGGKSVLLDRAAFRAWKQIEADLCRSADAIAVVSQPSVAILAGQYPDIADRLLVAPTCTPVPAADQLRAWREATRRSLGLSDEWVAAYAGSWFEPGPTLALFKRLAAAQPQAPWHFLLLVSARAQGQRQSAAESFKALLRQELGPHVRCTVAAVAQAAVVSHLAAADLAAQPIGVSETASADPRYVLTARTLLSVKFTEYLAAGLPVIVSRWAGAAAEIARAHDLGIVYDEASAAELAAWLARWQTARAEFRVRAWQYAREHFAVETLAVRYGALYHRLLS